MHDESMFKCNQMTLRNKYVFDFLGDRYNPLNIYIPFFELSAKSAVHQRINNHPCLATLDLLRSVSECLCRFEPVCICVQCQNAGGKHHRMFGG